MPGLATLYTSILIWIVQQCPSPPTPPLPPTAGEKLKQSGRSQCPFKEGSIRTSPHVGRFPLVSLIQRQVLLRPYRPQKSITPYGNYFKAFSFKPFFFFIVVVIVAPPPPCSSRTDAFSREMLVLITPGCVQLWFLANKMVFREFWKQQKELFIFPLQPIKSQSSVLFDH